jgi:hypothetical protein
MLEFLTWSFFPPFDLEKREKEDKIVKEKTKQKCL